ncbi:uncharacterized protein LOC107982210 [Nasonia vitripennis]|uniref:Uncharacterized protein n=1 Tax=Nasonia vitripennis TaxID=7425 RepID=A0A7M7IVX3_NASVI|nr:uncharacterized protein LOC107982210 [Nasonia vitripennis]
MQIEYYKKKCAEKEKENEQLKLAMNANEETTKTVKGTGIASTQQEKDAVGLLHNIFELNQKDIDNIDGDKELTHIKKGVYINSLAYKDAFKSDNCQSFFTIKNRGIYGENDLLTRCVKKIAGSEERPLSPIKKEVVEDEFYKFLNIKRYPLHMIDNEMKKVNRYQHNSISSVKKSYRRRNKSKNDNESNGTGS